MNRARLSSIYAKTLDGNVEREADRLAKALVVRLAEYLWIHYPDASLVHVTTSNVTGATELGAILDYKGKVLWAVDGSGWEPDADTGPLLQPVEDVELHRERIRDDVNTLGTILPLATQWSTSFPGRAVRSSLSSVTWEIRMPSSTDRHLHMDEQRLDREAQRS